MRPREFKTIRLGFLVDGRCMSQAELAAVMGYSGQPMISDIENRVHDVPAQCARLIRAYAEGYRPRDWPRDRKGAGK